MDFRVFSESPWQRVRRPAPLPRCHSSDYVKFLGLRHTQLLSGPVAKRRAACGPGAPGPRPWRVLSAVALAVSGQPGPVGRNNSGFRACGRRSSGLPGPGDAVGSPKALGLWPGYTGTAVSHRDFKLATDVLLRLPQGSLDRTQRGPVAKKGQALALLTARKLCHSLVTPDPTSTSKPESEIIMILPHPGPE